MFILIKFSFFLTLDEKQRSFYVRDHSQHLNCGINIKYLQKYTTVLRTISTDLSGSEASPDPKLFHLTREEAWE